MLFGNVNGELDLDPESKQVSGASQTLSKILESIPKDAARPTAGVHVAHLPTVPWNRGMTVKDKYSIFAWEKIIKLRCKVFQVIIKTCK